MGYGFAGGVGVAWVLSADQNAHGVMVAAVGYGGDAIAAELQGDLNGGVRGLPGDEVVVAQPNEVFGVGAGLGVNAQRLQGQVQGVAVLRVVNAYAGGDVRRQCCAIRVPGWGLAATSLPYTKPKPGTDRPADDAVWDAGAAPAIGVDAQAADRVDGEVQHGGVDAVGVMRW